MRTMKHSPNTDVLVFCYTKQRDSVQFVWNSDGASVVLFVDCALQDSGGNGQRVRYL